MRLVCLLLLAVLTTFSSLAQRQVSARVVAQGSGEALPQVTVRVEGQPAAITTDAQGRFALTLAATSAPNATLTFSHVGYQPLTVPADKLGATVSLAEQRYLIGEVQVSYVQLQKLLLRQWRVAPASLDIAAQRMTEQVRAKDPKRAETLEKNPEALRKVMDMIRYEFRPNGIVKTKLLMAGSKLRWQLDEETRTLTVVDEDGGERKIKVVELTAERLVLQHADGAQPGITYVPAD